MKHALYILCYAIRHVSGMKRHETENIKLVSLAIIKLHLTEGISQSVSISISQSVRKFPLNNFSLKFHSNFLEAFQVILKALWAWLYQIDTAKAP